MRQAKLITIDNKLVKAGYDLELNEKRILLTFIGNIINKVKREKLTDEDGEIVLDEKGKEVWVKPELEYQETIDPLQKYTITAKEFSDMWRIEVKSVYEIFENIGESFRRKQIKIETEEDKIGFPWLTWSRYNKPGKYFEIRWTPEVIPYISGLKSNFTTYQLVALVGIKSVYTIRLFELAAMLQKMKNKTLKLSLAELKEMLGISTEYESYGKFKQIVLKPAEKTISERLGRKIRFIEHKENRKVVAVTLQLFLEIRKKGKKEEENEWDFNAMEE